jgi:hypothetical protein
VVERLRKSVEERNEKLKVRAWGGMDSGRADRTGTSIGTSLHQSRTVISAYSCRVRSQEEMLGKLKDLGNTILGNFGLSLDNFKAVKDPQTGSYSISFQR